MNIIKSIFKSRDRPRLHGRAVQRQRNDQPKNHQGDSVGGGRSFPFGRAWSGKSVTERTAMQTTAVYTSLQRVPFPENCTAANAEVFMAQKCGTAIQNTAELYGSAMPNLRMSINAKLRI